MNLILFGFKASGKSYFGRRLSETLSCPFVDTDQLIQGSFCEIGEAEFRKREHLAILSLEGLNNTIIALGGGAILHPESQLFLKNLGSLVYLKAAKELLKNRLLTQNPLSALLDKNDLEFSFERLYQQRTALYEAIPAHSIVLEEKSDEQVIEELKAIYGQ